jgi:hypothetical protein
MVLYHGVLIVPVALVGAFIGLRQRNQAVILGLGWLLMILEFSSLGLLEKIFPWLSNLVLRYDYPFSIAWHGPIIPYIILGGMGLLWMWERWLERRVGQLVRRRAIPTRCIDCLAFLVLAFNNNSWYLAKGALLFRRICFVADVRNGVAARKHAKMPASHYPGTSR